MEPRALTDEAARQDHHAGEYHTLRIPPGTRLDGAVVELHLTPGRTIVDAEVRIPAPKSAIDAYQEASNEIHYLTGD